MLGYVPVRSRCRRLASGISRVRLPCSICARGRHPSCLVPSLSLFPPLPQGLRLLHPQVFPSVSSRQAHGLFVTAQRISRQAGSQCPADDPLPNPLCRIVPASHPGSYVPAWPLLTLPGREKREKKPEKEYRYTLRNVNRKCSLSLKAHAKTGELCFKFIKNYVNVNTIHKEVKKNLFVKYVPITHWVCKIETLISETGLRYWAYN